MHRDSPAEPRPIDVMGDTVMKSQTAAEEIAERGPRINGKDLAAVALGRKGGYARAKSMMAEKRSEIAKIAAKKRWGTPKTK